MRGLAGCISCLSLCACQGPLSALHPAGAEAQSVARLTFLLAGVVAIVWLIMMALMLYATQIRRAQHPGRLVRLLVIGGGVTFPTLVLAGLLTYSLSLMPKLRQPGDGLRVAVSGERWWWRVRYEPPGREPVELANEIRLPLGQRIEFELSSPDVIHSFWIPALGGKLDMIPGRTNRLVLEPTRTGRFRGICAEYCGESHAKMGFVVEVMEPAAFEDWLRVQAEPARADTGDPRIAAGQQRFFENGCDGCHRIRGTTADSRIGPDLTHIGSRLSIGAAALPAGPEHLRHWIAHTGTVKPGVLMPAFSMLPAEDLDALSHYLSALQ